MAIFLYMRLVVKHNRCHIMVDLSLFEQTNVAYISKIVPDHILEFGLKIRNQIPSGFITENHLDYEWN